MEPGARDRGALRHRGGPRPRARARRRAPRREARQRADRRARRRRQAHRPRHRHGGRAHAHHPQRAWCSAPPPTWRPSGSTASAGGPAVDVYATAAVAFEMLSGRKAVTGQTAIEIARRVMEAPPPDLAEVLPGTPRRAAEVLKRGLAKDPAERPASAGRAGAGAVRRLRGGAHRGASQSPSRAGRHGAGAADRGTGAAPARRSSAAAAARSLPAAPGRMPRRGGESCCIASSGRRSPRSQGALQSQARREAAEQGRRRDERRPRPPPPRAGARHAGAGARARQTPAAGSAHRRLTSFYTRAANDDFEGAWALGTDNLHAQFGSLETSSARHSPTLESISFPALRVKSQSGAARDRRVQLGRRAHRPHGPLHRAGDARSAGLELARRPHRRQLRRPTKTKKTKKPKR